jgi:glycosyltransferase involved in cell wall biosynthesis
MSAARQRPTRTSRSKPAAYKLPKELKKLKVAIVHDWLIGGGAELVVEELHRMFPDAPIYTSYATREWKQRLDGKVRTGILQYWPFSRMRKFLPVLRTRWFSHLKLSGYDLVISSSGAEAKGIQVPKGTLHVNYCHAPTHYYWSRYDEYMKRPGFGPFNFLARFGLLLLVGPLRKWDYKAAQRPHYIIANSTHIKQDIKKYYGRKAAVIFPPVNTEKFKPTGYVERFGFVMTGRQTPYKRHDLGVEACSRLHAPLKVIGKGPEYHNLTAMSGPSVRFLGYLSDADLVRHLQISECYIFPGLDDFGISPVEAMAAGTPVIAYKGGGALDYVKEGVTGIFFEEQTVESLAGALQQFDPENFDSKKIIRSASRFSQASFRKKLEKSLVKYVKEFSSQTK